MLLPFSFVPCSADNYQVYFVTFIKETSDYVLIERIGSRERERERVREKEKERERERVKEKERERERMLK